MAMIERMPHQAARLMETFPRIVHAPLKAIRDQGDKTIPGPRYRA